MTFGFFLLVSGAFLLVIFFAVVASKREKHISKPNNKYFKGSGKLHFGDIASGEMREVDIDSMWNHTDTPSYASANYESSSSDSSSSSGTSDD